MKWSVSVEVIETFLVTVEADDEDEAVRKAEDMTLDYAPIDARVEYFPVELESEYDKSNPASKS